MSIAFLESIPTSVQVLAGFTAISGAGWAWFVRPRIAGMVAEAMGENREQIAGFHRDLSQKIAGTRADLSQEIAETRRDLSQDIADTHKEIAETRRDLSQEIAETRRDLSQDIADTRKKIAETRRGLSQEIAETRRDLSQDIADTRKEIAETRRDLSQEIAGNRDSITATRDLVSAARIETRDLLAEMRSENHNAHEAIGERINGLQVHITHESTALRTKMADLKSDTAKLAGAVDVLTIAMQGSGPPGRTQGKTRG